jgi:hypothetical protein
MSLGSIYFHFVEARRRTENRLDDFSAWLADFGPEAKEMIRALRLVDFYYMSLPELKDHLITSMARFHPELLNA